MKPVFLFLTFFYTFGFAVAQNSSPVLYALTEKNGLTDNVANCFLQDSRGVMWIGTNYGLNSFDGSEVRNFHAGKNGAGIADDVVNDLKEDGDHNLWMATGNGLTSYNLTNKKISNYRYNLSNEVLNRYYSIAILKSNIYLATEEGMLIFNIASANFEVVKNQTAASNHFTKIYIDSKQRIWAGTYNGLWQYDQATKTFSQYDSPQNDPLFDGLVNDIIEDHDHQIWFGCWTKGLKKLKPESKTVETFFQWKSSNGNVTSLAEQKNADGSYSLWQASILCKPDEKNQWFSYLSYNNKTILCNRIYCDNKNLLWISTSDGIKIYNPAKQYFLTTVLATDIPLTSQGIALFPLQQKFLLGGEGGTSLVLYSDSARVIKNLSSSIGNGAAVMNIQQDKTGDYWVCSSNGLFVLDESMNQKKKFLHNDKDKNSLPKNFLNYSLLKKDGSIFILPWRDGVWQIDNNDKFYRAVTVKGDTLLTKNNLSKAIEDNNGNIWITDYSSGLFKYDPKTGAVKNLITSRRFSNEYILNGKLWTVSSGEIFSVDINADKIDTFYLPQGKKKYEYDFIPDKNGWFWIATKTGLVAFNSASHQFKTFTQDDGLFSNDLIVTFAQLSNGNILMASGNFATTFSPDIVKQNSEAAGLLLTGVASDQHEKMISGNSFEFNWDEKNIQLTWALLNYSNPTGNIYYYKLDGINGDWQNAGNKGQVSFNSLQPGKYIFHYKAATSDGVESEEKTIELIIYPPFWKTWWFILLMAILILSVFYGVVKYISQRNLKEKLLRLEKEQAVEKERNRISRDMHDDLGSGLTKIAILSEVIKTQPSSSEKNIEKISETARSLVDNLDEMVWALNPKNDSLDKLVAYLAEYTNQYLEGTGIDCLIDLPAEIDPVHVSEEKRRNIFMSVKEFLNNSVKHSAAKTISFQLTQQATGFEIIIKDDGKGFDKNSIASTGNGLKNINQRIEDIGGHALLTSSIKGTVLQIRVDL